MYKNIEILTIGTGWWIGEVSINGESFDLEGIDTTNENFIIIQTEFTIERKNSTEVYISMQQNQSETERVLLTGLQAGTYFDEIKVT